MPAKTKQEAIATPAKSKKNGPLISDNKLKEIYAAMLRCRMLGERIQESSRHEKHKSRIGQEATAVGLTIDLRRQDTLAVPPHSLIFAYLKGVPAGEVFSLLSSKSAGLERENLQTSHQKWAAVNFTTSVADSATLAGIATGVAFANRKGKNAHVVVAFIDSPPAQSCWTGALEFAALHSLPIIYVLQSNAAVTRTAGGIPAIPVDGNDAVAVYRVAQEAMARARQGEGPTVIACRSWLLTGSTRQRKIAEDRRAQEPLEFMEEYLTRKGLFQQSWKQNLAERFRRELDAAAALITSGNRA